MKKTKQSSLPKYDCLLILDAGTSEDKEKEILNRVQKEVQAVGGKVEKVERMGQQPFARASNGKTAGLYVNLVIAAPAQAPRELDARFHLDTDLFRWMITTRVAAPVRKNKNADATK